MCDVCLTSNVRLRIVPATGHPLPRMLDAGVSVTLNADDVYWFRSSIDREVELAHEAFSLSDEMLAQIARAGIQRNGAPSFTLQRMISGIDRWLNRGPATPS